MFGIFTDALTGSKKHGIMRSYYQNKNECLNTVCFIVLTGTVQSRSLTFKV